MNLECKRVHFQTETREVREGVERNVTRIQLGRDKDNPINTCRIIHPPGRTTEHKKFQLNLEVF